MIYLRSLKEKDAVLMLEWMHDAEIQKAFQKKMINLTLDDAIKFCRESNKNDTIADGINMHYAIVDETDEYYGTVSLKKIDLRNKNAEYAIAMRRSAQGKGIAWQATKLVLQIGFDKFKLHRIYLNVLKDNERAIHFYRKFGFIYEGEFRDCLLIDGQYKTLEWYSMLNDND